MKSGIISTPIPKVVNGFSTSNMPTFERLYQLAPIGQPSRFYVGQSFHLHLK